MIYQKNQILLNLDDQFDNFVSINNGDRRLLELDDFSRGGKKGFHSCVFQAVDPNGDEDDLVIKICRYYLPGGSYKNRKLIQRFKREIEALKIVNASHFKDRVVNFIESGEMEISGKNFLYYVMEKGELDLRRYLDENQISIQQKVLFCIEILESLRGLHELGIYHRDIKPDNIFYVNKSWKIGDLGLIDYRDSDSNIDGKYEKIGPVGFMSPEAENKAFGGPEREDFNFDIQIDDKSDIFQLGKVFWYILQGEVPSGNVMEEDLQIDSASLFQNVLHPMLQYSKQRRPRIDELVPRFQEIRIEFAA